MEIPIDFFEEQLAEANSNTLGQLNCERKVIFWLGQGRDHKI
jgi:hypothetical protein